MRVQLENNDLFDPLIRKGFRMSVLSLIPVTNYQLDANSPPLLLLTPAGAINFRMPAATGNAGLRFTLVNLSASAITVQTVGGAAFASAIVLAAGQTAELICTGSATANLGWVAATAAGTQTSP